MSVKPNNRTISIHVIIDTDAIPPKLGADTVTPITIPYNGGYAIVTATEQATNQGTGDIAFDACAGDTVCFFATSGSNNFEQSILIHEISHTQGDDILQGFRPVEEERMTIAPASFESVLPIQIVPRQFRFWQCEVSCEGTGRYSLLLGFHDRDEDGQPFLVCHYKWELGIAVHLGSPLPEANTQN